MWSETRRPIDIEKVVGHTEVKKRVETYLKGTTYPTALLLHGPPGCGKTTLAIAAAHSFGFEPFEINASQRLRSHADVETLIQSCSHTRTIASFVRGDNRKKCLILDEIDGSDPHAQKKILDWLTEGKSIIPVLLTCNEVPRAFKQIECIRCFPPNQADLAKIFPAVHMPTFAKKHGYDMRRMIQAIQYGDSDILPTKTCPTNVSPEVATILKQKMWFETSPNQPPEIWHEMLSPHCSHRE